jgi:hypothetical protein
VVQKQRNEKHSLRVAQMGDREDGYSRASIRRVEECRRVERGAFEPLLETGGRQQPVQLHRELKSIFHRKERLEVEDAYFVEWRRLHQLNEPGQIEILPLPPGCCEQHRE